MSKYFLVILLLGNVGLWGQDTYEILEQISRVFASTDGLSYKVHYDYYDGLEAKVPNEQMEMEMASKGTQYYMKYNDYELFGDGKTHLIIDHLTKSIRMTKQKLKQTQGMHLGQFREMADEMGLVLRSFEPKGSVKGLEFVAPGKAGTVIRLIYDPDSYRLASTSIRIDLDEELAEGYEFNRSRIEATYTDYEVIEGRFPYRLGDFLVKGGKEGYRPVEAYARYVLGVF